jgi:hypothetical protein
MHVAWTNAGAKAQFIAAPSFGADGHLLFGVTGIPVWRGYASAFLRTLGLPAWETPPMDAPASVPVPAGLNRSGSDAFESYRRSTNFHKAFAVGETGRYAWTSGHATRAEAAEATLKRCNEKGPCRLVRIDDEKTE